MAPVLDTILDRIYRENPTWWPYGLKRSMLDEAFLVRHPLTKQPCGFTGWQFRTGMNGVKTGFYAVGILPEFRRQGLAKQALQEMFDQHQPVDVTERKAFIVQGNKPSEALASSLGVPFQHKAAGLHAGPPNYNVNKMAKLEPNSYNGVSMQQFMPLVSRRHSFSPGEQRAIEEGQSQWFPRVFKSLADSPAADMMSPGRAALMAGLGGGAVAGLGMNALGATPGHTAAGALGVGSLAALAAHFATRAHNNTVEETMRRIPANGTRRDVLSDPVLQAELNRGSHDGAAQESLRTAQLLAVLQAAKQASIKLAGWADFAKAVGQHFTTHSNKYLPGLAAVGGGIAYDGAMHNFNYDHFTPARGLNSVVNAGLFGMAANRNAFGGDGLKRMGLAMSAPVKDVAISGGAAINNLNSMMPELRDALSQAGKPPAPSVAPAPGSSSFSDAVKFVGDHPWLSGGAALGGLGLLGIGGSAAGGALRDLRDSMSRDQGGRIRVTLPTRRQGDAETSLDLPVRDMPLSDALLGRLQRDTRSRLHAETKERTHHRVLSPEEKARRTAILLQHRRA